MKIISFLLLWVPGAICECKAQAPRKPANDRSVTAGTNAVPIAFQQTIPDSLGSAGQAAERQTCVQMMNVFNFIPGAKFMEPMCLKMDQNKVQGMWEQRQEQPVKLGKICAAKIALTSFVLMAGNLPYLFKSLRSPDKSGIRLTSQKARIAAGNKGFKRVTGLTFAVPLAR